MRLFVDLGAAVVAAFLLASCSSGSPSDEPIGLYIEKIIGRPVSKKDTYILVSDYGCSSCKEEIYRKAESGSADTVFIITSPRNTAILMERFNEMTPKGTIHIDSLKYSKTFDIVFSKPMVVAYKDEGWEISTYQEGVTSSGGM